MRDFLTFVSLRAQLLCVAVTGVAGILLTTLAERSVSHTAQLGLPIAGALLPLVVAAIFSTRLTARASRLQRAFREAQEGEPMDFKGRDELTDLARLAADGRRRLEQQRQRQAEAGAVLGGAIDQVQDLCGESQVALRRQHQALVQIRETLPELQRTQATLAVAGSGLAGSRDALTQAGKEESASTRALEELLAEIGDRLVGAEGALASISQQSIQVGSALSSLDEIAEQISLIALNTSIEAARAGAGGQGVAVMADEVSELAARARHFTGGFGRTVSELGEGARLAGEPLRAGQSLLESGRAALVGLRDGAERRTTNLRELTARAAAGEQALEETLEITIRLVNEVDSAVQRAGETEEAMFRMAQRTRALRDLAGAHFPGHSGRRGRGAL